MTTRPPRLSAILCAVLAPCAAALAQAPQSAPQTGKSVAFAVSRNVREMPSVRPDPDSNLPAEWIRDNDRLPHSRGPYPNVSTPDAALQRPRAAPNMPLPSATFAGISADDAAPVGGRFAPPDTVGDVGPNHYVQAVNTVLRVFDKNGAALSSLVSLGTFFNPLGTGCNGQFGDPVILYDSLADRWLISQFGLPNGFSPPFHQCIGISQTPDPTGAFYLYDFVMPNKVNDYPHFGVWPDGYYMSDNQFAIGGGSYAGAGLLAFDRLKMLAGDATAGYIYFDYGPIDPTSGGMLPSDVDGLTPPPAGTPNLFMEFRADEYGDPNDAIRVYEFHADFATPSNSTLTVLPDLVVAPFDARSPGGRNIVEEPPPAASADYLDAIADRMMFRIAYRTLAGGVQSFVANWTVNVSGVNPTSPGTYQAGVRFSELRRDPGTGAMSIQNQVTYSTGLRQRRDRAQPVDGLGRAGQPGQQRRRVLGLERVAQALADLGGAPGRRSRRYAQPGRGHRVRGHGRAAGIGQPMGGLQRPHGRPLRRLHVLLHAGVLRRQRQLRLGDARGQVRLSRVRGAGAGDRLGDGHDLWRRRAGRGDRVRRPRPRARDGRRRALLDGSSARVLHDHDHQAFDVVRRRPGRRDRRQHHDPRRVPGGRADPGGGGRHDHGGELPSRQRGSGSGRDGDRQPLPQEHGKRQYDRPRGDPRRDGRCRESARPRGFRRARRRRRDGVPRRRLHRGSRGRLRRHGHGDLRAAGRRDESRNGCLRLSDGRHRSRPLPRASTASPPPLFRRAGPRRMRRATRPSGSSRRPCPTRPRTRRS